MPWLQGTSNGNWTEWNSGSNRASNFKSAERVAQGGLVITSMITPELNEMKSSDQLIVSITKCKIRKSTCPLGMYF